MNIAVSSVDVGEVFDSVGEQVKQLIDYDHLSVYFHRSGEDFVEGHAITTDCLGPLVRLPLH